MLNGIFQGQDTPLGLGLIPDIGVLLSHAHHDTLVPGTPDNGGENGPRRIVASKASLAHARAIVDHKSGNLVITHDGADKCRAVLSIKKLTPSLVEKNWHPEEAWPRIIYRILLLLTAL